MVSYRIDMNDAIAWFRLKASLFTDSGVQMADVSASGENVPSATADFDSENAIGRISIWATGEVDLEVLTRSDGEFAFFRHESVMNLAASVLDHAYYEFVRNMLCRGVA